MPAYTSKSTPVVLGRGQNIEGPDRIPPTSQRVAAYGAYNISYNIEVYHIFVCCSISWLMIYRSVKASMDVARDIGSPAKRQPGVRKNPTSTVGGFEGGGVVAFVF